MGWWVELAGGVGIPFPNRSGQRVVVAIWTVITLVVNYPHQADTLRCGRHGTTGEGGGDVITDETFQSLALPLSIHRSDVLGYARLIGDSEVHSFFESPAQRQAHLLGHTSGHDLTDATPLRGAAVASKFGPHLTGVFQ